MNDIARTNIARTNISEAEEVESTQILVMHRIRLYSIEFVLAMVLLLAVAYFGYLGYGLLTPSFVLEPYSGDQALDYAETQLDFGPRPTGSTANINMGDWLIEELRILGWDVVILPFTTASGVSARNIVAIRSPTPSPSRSAMLMSHYDTRLRADRDPNSENHSEPSPGANAGASGPAVLLELARTLDVSATGHTMCLVFLDAEENAGIEGWDNTLGSEQLVERLDSDLPRCRSPRFAVYVDMVGNLNQRLYAESTSYTPLIDSIWNVARELGYSSHFINEPTWSAVDAHTRMREIDVPAVTIADYNYPHRDTLADTADKLDADSFERVGTVLKTWLERGAPF